MWQQLKGSSRFGQELETWVTEGLITTDQAATLSRRYELDQEPAWYKQSGNLLKATALLISAMGFFLLIGANWDHLPRAVRVLTGLLPLVAAYGFAIRCMWDDDQQKAELAMIFGTLAFGANIALQAQIFHISAYFPDGILWWIIGAMPVIWFFRSAFLHVVFQALFIGWLGIQNTYYQFSWWSPLLMAGFAYLLYIKPNAFGLLLMLGSFYMFIVNGIIAAEQAHLATEYVWSLLPAFWLVYGLLFLVLFGYVHHQYSERVNRWLPWLMQVGLASLFYSQTFFDLVREIFNQSAVGGIPISLWVMAVIAVGLYLNRPKTATMNLNFGIMFFLLLPALLVLTLDTALATAQNTGLISPGIFYQQTREMAKVYEWVANVLFIAFAVWKVWYGTHTRQKDIFMTGIFWLVVWVLGRYMVLVGDYLTTGLIFIGFGIGLYFVNKLWDSRLREGSPAGKSINQE